MRVLARLIMAVLLGACGAAGAGAGGAEPAGVGLPPPTESPGRPPDYEGVVDAVTPLEPASRCVDVPAPSPDAPVSSTDPSACAATPLGTLLIEAAEPVSVTVEQSTRIRAEAADGSVSDATFGDIEVGQGVAVYTDGLVRESYPVQVTAVELVLLSRG